LIDMVHDTYDLAKSGHFSEMYRSAASRTTHANETFFSLAIVSNVSYTSGGKLMDARIVTALSAAFIFFPFAFLDFMLSPSLCSPHYTMSVNW